MLYDRPGPLAESRALVIPHGTLAEVAQTLAESGVIGDKLAFRVAAVATSRHGPLHAGELAFPENATLREVLQVLRTAKPVQHRLTIPEGLTAQQIGHLLDTAAALTGAPATPPEGSMLPQTYAYEYGATRASLVERATAAMQRALALAWAGRDADLPLASPENLLVLASIVERETARPEERPRIAGVLLNRLRRGMKLQTDPTVIYAVSNGAGALDRPLSHADLESPSPYNTYRAAGLPPGPIGSPGLAAIAAVAHPEPTPDLYFVADGSGGHAFSTTLDEHQKKVAHWRAVEPPQPKH